MLWKRGVAGIVAGLTSALSAGSFLLAQTISTSGTETRIQVAPQPGPGPGSDALSKEEKLNSDRHTAVVSDVEKLLALAQQFNAEVASNPMGSLTSEQMRKLSSIERLARDIKFKMTHPC